MMTFGFMLITVGSVLMLSGYENKSIGSVLGELSKKPEAGGTSFSAYLTGAGSGVAEAFTGGGSVAPEGGNATLESEGGTVTIDGKPVDTWIAKEIEWARKHGWSGTVTSGYRTEAEQIPLYQAYLAGGNVAAKPGTSNHEKKHFPGGAVDVTEPEQLDQVLSHKLGRKLHYTGKSIGDYPHFSSGLDGV